MTFASRLKTLRTEKGITQNELSAATGLSHGCIAMLEVEKRAPTGSTLSILADFFNVSVDYLLGRENDFGVISVQKEKDALSEEEKALVEAYRKLNMKNRMHVAAYAQVRLEEQERVIFKKGS